MPSLNLILDDRPLAEKLLSPDTRSIMLLGEADTGKTTLAGALSSFLSKDFRTAAVDLDMGQSCIGPPTTVGWGFANKNAAWDKISPEEIYFIGALSPPGSLVPTLVGAKRMTDGALQRAEKVVIDTTGLVSGEIGTILKQYKIELLCPDIVIALERYGELGEILDGFRASSKPMIWRLKAPESARTRTGLMRAAYREERFREYFARARLIEVSLNETGLRYTGGKGGEMAGRLVSFRDSSQKDLALGIIEAKDLDGNRLIIRTPLKEDARYAAIVVGRATVLPGND